MKNFWKYFIIVIFILSLIRLSFFVGKFGSDILQLDFSTFYTAGQSVAYGLNPYDNNILIGKNFWDGWAMNHFSQFLYPPIMANFFQLFSFLPYIAAKYVWMVTSLLLIYLSVKIFCERINVDWRKNRYLLASLISLFYPLISLLNAGQIDAFTLFILVLFIGLMVFDKKYFLAGVVLSFAVFFKLHTIYLLPFLFLMKKWKAVYGLIFGGVVILVIMTIISGPSLTKDYFLKELPRISKYSYEGNQTTRLDLSSLNISVNNDVFEKNGRKYQSGFEMFNTASLVPFINNYLKDRGATLPISLYSLSLFAIFLLLSITWFVKKGFNNHFLSEDQENLLWIFAFCVVLLSAPLTWASNALWLVLLFPLLVKIYYNLDRDKNNPIHLCLAVFSLALIAIPDSYGFPLAIPYFQKIFMFKYVAGEMGLLLSIFLMLNNYNFRKVKLSNMRVVIFDVDGTLYDLNKVYYRVIIEMFIELIRKPGIVKDFWIIYRFRSIKRKITSCNNEQEIFSLVANKLNCDQERLKLLINDWTIERPLKYIKKYKFPGLEVFIDYLNKNGIQVYFLSDNPAREKISSLNLRGKVFYFGDSIIKEKKPNTSGLMTILSEAGIKAEDCLLLGDQNQDRLLSKNVEANFLMVDGNDFYHKLLKY